MIDLRQKDMFGQRWADVHIQNVVFDRVNLRCAVFEKVRFENVVFVDCDITEAYFGRISGSGIEFRGTCGSRTTFSEFDAPGIVMNDCYFPKSVIASCTFDCGRFSDVFFNEVFLTQSSFKGANLRSCFFGLPPITKPRFSGIDFTDAEIIKCEFGDDNFVGFYKSTFVRTNLWGTNVCIIDLLDPINDNVCIPFFACPEDSKKYRYEEFAQNV